MVSVHLRKHVPLMRTLLDRAGAAGTGRPHAEAPRCQDPAGAKPAYPNGKGTEGLAEDMDKLAVIVMSAAKSAGSPSGSDLKGNEWD